MSLEIPKAPRRDARSTTSLLGSRHRDSLAALRAAAAQHLTASAGLLARSKAVGALPALVVWLVCTLHDWSPGGAAAERDRYSTTPLKSRSSHRADRPDSGVLRRRSGVHLPALWACNPKSASDTNAGFL